MKIIRYFKKPLLAKGKKATLPEYLFLLSILISFIIIEYYAISIANHFNGNPTSVKKEVNGSILLFIKVIVLGPIIEEIIYRYFLVPTKHFTLFFVLILFEFVKILLKYKFIVYAYLLELISIAIYLVYFNLNKEKVGYNKKIIYKKFGTFFFYYSAIIFSICHLVNKPVNLIIVLYFISHFVFSLLVSFVRIRYRFYNSIIFHISHNFIITMVALYHLLPELKIG